VDESDAILFDHLGFGMRDATKFAESSQMLNLSLVVASLCYRQVRQYRGGKGPGKGGKESDPSNSDPNDNRNPSHEEKPIATSLTERRLRNYLWKFDDSSSVIRRDICGSPDKGIQN
jgi:hypothetical protein